MNKKRIKVIGIEIIILIILYGFINSKWIENLPSCWIYQTTGILCPGCGGTRCVIQMLKGNWIQAFLLHSVFFMGIVYLLSVNIIFMINLNREKKIGTWLYPQYWYGIIFAIFLGIYTIVRNLL